MTGLLIHSAAQLLTVRSLAAPGGSVDGPAGGSAQSDLGLIEDGAVLIRGERIAAVGMTHELLPQAEQGTRLVDARGKVVLPGLIDAHTHVVFAGDRANEFERRLAGATYLEIMEAGGGIMSTVRATRAASVDALVAQSAARLAGMLSHGTTTAEVKTGYGLTTATELKLLAAIDRLGSSQPVELIPTFLGAHAFPSEFIGREGDYVDLVADEMLPATRRSEFWEKHPGMFCDVFCDRGAFSLAQSRRILSRARELGFGLKIHADEFQNLGAASLAAELRALSADHLVVTTREQIRELGAQGVIAVLLPGTTFGLGQTDFADGRAFVDENVPVALGSDINPGTSWCESLPLTMAIAVRYEHLTPAEAIVAATRNAAFASGVGSKVGSIEAGRQADLLIAAVSDYRDLVYRYGTNPIQAVVKRGELVAGSWPAPEASS